VWEGWKAGAFHTLSFPWLVLETFHKFRLTAKARFATRTKPQALRTLRRWSMSSLEDGINLFSTEGIGAPVNRPAALGASDIDCHYWPMCQRRLPNGVDRRHIRDVNEIDKFAACDRILRSWAAVQNRSFIPNWIWRLVVTVDVMFPAVPTVAPAAVKTVRLAIGGEKLEWLRTL
jgi:hypothetical protein